MGLLVARVVSMLCLGLVTWLLGLLPLLGVRRGWLAQQESRQTQARPALQAATPGPRHGPHSVH